MKRTHSILFSVLCLAFSSCDRIVRITNAGLQLEVNSRMESRLNSPGLQQKPFMSSFAPSEYLVYNRQEITDFHLQSSESHAYKDNIGNGNFR